MQVLHTKWSCNFSKSAYIKCCCAAHWLLGHKQTEFSKRKITFLFCFGGCQIVKSAQWDTDLPGLVWPNSYTLLYQSNNVLLHPFCSHLLPLIFSHILPQNSIFIACLLAWLIYCNSCHTQFTQVWLPCPIFLSLQTSTINFPYFNTIIQFLKKAKCYYKQ